MFVDIKVGYACNDRCIHCVMEPVRRDLRGQGERSEATTEEALSMISAAKERGARGVVLTGGEVTIRQDFARLATHAIGLGLEVTIQTNGRRLGKPGFLDFLGAARCVGFVVALHGPDADVHDRVTQVHGSFAETEAGIRAVVSHPRAVVTGKIVLSRVNLDTVPATVALYGDLGVREIWIAFPHIDGFHAAEIPDIAPRYAAVAPVVRESLAIASERRVNLVFETVPYCVVPDVPQFWTHSQDARYAAEAQGDGAAIDAYGLQAIDDWGAQRRSIKRKFACCADCVFDRVCEGPWAEYVDAFGPSEFSPAAGCDEAERSA